MKLGRKDKKDRRNDRKHEEQKRGKTEIEEKTERNIFPLEALKENTH
jgi:hypothetical protein